MKLPHLLALVAFATITGCSSQGNASAQPPDPNVNLSAQEKIDNIKNDPEIPDGLKQIQIDTLQRQPGAK